MEAFPAWVRRKSFRVTVYIFAGTCTFVAVMLLLGQTWIESKVDKRALRQQLNAFIVKSPVGISYGGIDVSLLHGIRLIDVKVSAQKDFSQGRLLMRADELFIRTNWLQYQSKQPLSQIEIPEPRLNIYMKNTELPEETKAMLNHLFCSDSTGQISMENASLSVHASAKGYRKFFKTFSHVNASVKLGASRKVARVSFHEAKGGGSLFYEIGQCSPQEDWQKGRLQVSLNAMDLRYFNDYIVNYQIDSGILNLFLKRSYKKSGGKNYPFYEYRFSIENLKGGSDEHALPEPPRVTASGVLIKEDNLWKLRGKGYWGDFRYNLDWGGRENKEWPRFVSLTVEGTPGTDLYLPDGFRLRGLQSFQFLLEPSEKKWIYRIINGALQLHRGALYRNDETFLRDIDSAILINENKYKASFAFEYNKTRLRWEGQGELLPRAIVYTTIAYPYGDNRSVARTENLRVASGKHSWSLSFSPLAVGDLRPLFEKVRDRWRNELFRELNETANERLQYTTSFYWQWFARPQIELKLNARASVQEKEKVFSGALSLSSGILSAEIKDNDENRFSLQASYRNELPFYKGNLWIRTQGYEKLLLDFLEPGLVESVDEAQVEYDFKTSGRRPVELYENHQGQGHATLRHARLGNYFIQKSVPVYWDMISFQFKRSFSSIWLNPIEGQSQSARLYGYGKITSEYLKPKIDIVTDVRYLSGAP